METEVQNLVLFDGNLIPKRDVILESSSTKFKTQSPRGADEMGQEKGKGVRYAIKETLQFWDLDNSNFT